MNSKLERGDGIMLSQQEFQVLSFLVEHEEESNNMTTISLALCIAKSSLTQISKTLHDYGLIEKYKFVGNKKDIILKTTEYGKAIYSKYTKTNSVAFFQPLFDGLKSLSDEDLAVFVSALQQFNLSMMDGDERKLILYKECNEPCEIEK